MAEETTTPAAGTNTSASDGKNIEAASAGTVTQSANTEGAKGEAQKTEEAKADAGKTFTQDELETIVKTRLEQQRTSAKAAADQAAKAEADRLLAEQGKYQTLAEQRQAELDQARADLQKERLNNAVLTEAAANNVQNTTVLMKLIKDDVEFDAEGKPTNLKKLVEQAIKDVPSLVTTTQVEQTPGTTKVELPANNPSKTAQAADGPVSLYSPGLFKR